MQPVLFLDRDGVINQKARPPHRYVLRWEDFHFMPGIVEVLRHAGGLGYRLVVVTNQQCVGKGLLSTQELNRIHQRMRDHLALHGAPLSDIRYCPHLESDRCECRKPKPGLLYQVEADPRRSCLLGDSPSDIIAGQSFGASTILLGSALSIGDGVAPDHHVETLTDLALVHILSKLSRRCA